MKFVFIAFGLLIFLAGCGSSANEQESPASRNLMPEAATSVAVVMGAN
jgi:hypothetical protein